MKRNVSLVAGTPSRHFRGNSTRRLRQARQVHAPRAVPQHRVEIHLALVAVGEGERERAPDVIHDLVGIEVRNPTSASGQDHRRDSRGIAAIGADADEPGLRRAGWVEGEPAHEHSVVG